VAAWHTVADALGLADWVLEQGPHHDLATRVLHGYRSGTLLSGGAAGEEDDGRRAVLGVVGELDPALVEAHGLVSADGRPRPVGWLDLDLDVLLDPVRTARRPLESLPVSRFPSSDTDLAFVVPEEVPAGMVEATLAEEGGDLLESVQLFDVYRGESVGGGARSLAYRLRFCALDRTLTDEEIGRLRVSCIAAVERVHGATLR
jgi:phenylalanyl-tRNA synthetase beta chain